MLQLEFISGTVVVQPEPVDKKGTFRGPEFRSKKKEKRESTLGVCFVLISSSYNAFIALNLFSSKVICYLISEYVYLVHYFFLKKIDFDSSGSLYIPVNLSDPHDRRSPAIQNEKQEV